MSVSITIKNKTFSIPQSAEDPDWSEGVTDWIIEVNKVVSSLFGPGDLLETTFIIPASNPTPASIIGMSFNSSIIRSIVVEYGIVRGTSSESGILNILYDPALTDWKFSQEAVEDAGVTFSITSGGQIQYTADAGSTGTIKFKASGITV